MPSARSHHGDDLYNMSVHITHERLGQSGQIMACTH